MGIYLICMIHMVTLQGNTDDLQAFLDTKKVEGQLDFIIDDGSHHPQHQITSFKYLFEKGLKPGGVYIIEVKMQLHAHK